MALELMVAALVLLGAAFALLGSLALVRLPDFYTRLHGPTKATTLGVGATLLASALHLGVGTGAPRELLVLLFLFATAPVSAQLLARAARHLGVEDAAAAGDPERSSVTDDGQDNSRGGAQDEG
ncbi:monovalent cation/H(+) antiporter subunit G [uncultured Thiohalocapsa sp.]|uniref:monovalent cation/H(+) antiporter subunit G n=1 Tax=uncultured Thiohalocapsa sp. TaxID=768990 RepID=UPI0025EEB76B|nr:monovalent cation/H(+) antiporter subunit G [uncultured Thiohalocapsa sp.]